MTPGAVLAAKRGERGLSIQQVVAATHIRADHLEALEEDDLTRFPAAVYAKGYMRTYARYLGVDPEPLIATLEEETLPPRLALGLGSKERKPRMVLTGPAFATVGLVLLAAAFSAYAWRQITLDQRSSGTPPGAPVAAASPLGTPAASPSIQPRPIVVGVRVTDVVWINAVVDGTPQYGGSGKTLTAGSVVYFTGVDVKITSGKAAATYISIDGHSLGPLGAGVATREFTSQTAP
jgi:cytoskeleton protein RodZ